MAMDICQKISCWLPDVNRLHGYYKGMVDLIRVDTDKSVDPAHNEIRPRLCLGIQDEEARHNSKSVTCFLVVLCNAPS